MTQTAVVGDSPLSELLAGRLDATPDGAVVCWNLDPIDDDEQRLVAFEQALLRGFATTRAVLTRDAGSPRRVVHVVRADAPDALSTAFRAAVGGFAKSLAREVARDGVTVNAVGLLPGATDAETAAVEAARYLLTGDAGFITGQALGSAGERLGRPRPHAAAPAEDPRTVLVSGGAGAIGAAITRRLHADGRRVLIGYVREDAAKELATGLDASQTTCAPLALDLTDSDAIRAALDALDATAGPLDLVLCGGWVKTGPFVTRPESEDRQTLKVNLTGPARLLHGLLPRLRRDGGAVVGIASESGRIGDSGRAVYGTCKASLCALLAAVNATADPVRAATVAPGPIDTPLLYGTHATPEAAEAGVAALRRLVPLRRLGRPEEVADAVAFLLSPAGGALAGEVVSVGGGITMQ